MTANVADRPAWTILEAPTMTCASLQRVADRSIIALSLSVCSICKQCSAGGALLLIASSTMPSQSAYICTAEHHRQQQQRARGAGEGPGRGEAAGELGLPADQLRHVHQLRHARRRQPVPAQHQAPQAGTAAAQLHLTRCSLQPVWAKAHHLSHVALPHNVYAQHRPPPGRRTCLHWYLGWSLAWTMPPSALSEHV